MTRSFLFDDDMDVVDLLQDLEQAFGLRLTDEELQRCRTIGDLFGLMETRIERSSNGSCATAMCFYRLRRALQPRITMELRPKTGIVELRSVPVRRLHRIIDQECGLRPPPPYISLWGCIALILVAALPLFALAAGWPLWLALTSVVPAVALYRMAPMRLPRGVNTFGDLVRVVASRSIGTLSKEGARLGSTEAWAAFKDIVSGHSPFQEVITPDALILAPRKLAS
jgi:hypothetical protein